MKIAFVFINYCSGAGRGAGYVLASIPRNHSVIWYNTPWEREPTEVLREILSRSFDIVMISTTSLYWSLVRDMIEVLNGKIPVLLGGLHAVMFHGKLLEECPGITYLCAGEGETFVKEFLTLYGTEEFYKIPDLVWRDGDIVRENPTRDPGDLTTLPAYPWYLFPRVVNERNEFNLHVARGCQFSCPYCCNCVYLKKWGKKYLRHRDVSSIVSEIKILNEKYHPSSFFFGDEEIFSYGDFFRELFTAVKKQTGLFWGCMARPENLSEDAIGLMKETGCKYVGIGVECGDEEFRKAVLRRGVSNKDLIRVFSSCNKAGFTTTSYNMIGYPNDQDVELCLATRALNEQLKPSIFQVTWYYPFRGTEMGDMCHRENLVDEKHLLLSYHNGSVLKAHSHKGVDAHQYINNL